MNSLVQTTTRNKELHNDYRCLVLDYLLPFPAIWFLCRLYSRPTLSLEVWSQALDFIRSDWPARS